MGVLDLLSPSKAGLTPAVCRMQVALLPRAQPVQVRQPAPRKHHPFKNHLPDDQPSGTFRRVAQWLEQRAL